MNLSENQSWVLRFLKLKIFLGDCKSNFINYMDTTTLYTCEPNMGLVFTGPQKSYLEANSGKSHLFNNI